LTGSSPALGSPQIILLAELTTVFTVSMMVGIDREELN
jgi:hypothetical protein